MPLCRNTTGSVWEAHDRYCFPISSNLVCHAATSDPQDICLVVGIAGGLIIEKDTNPEDLGIRQYLVSGT